MVTALGLGQQSEGSSEPFDSCPNYGLKSAGLREPFDSCPKSGPRSEGSIEPRDCCLRPALEDLARRLRTRFGPRLRDVRLFGSWARGEQHEDSDVDVLVLVDGLTWEEWRDCIVEDGLRRWSRLAVATDEALRDGRHVPAILAELVQLGHVWSADQGDEVEDALDHASPEQLEALAVAIERLSSPVWRWLDEAAPAASHPHWYVVDALVLAVTRRRRLRR